MRRLLLAPLALLALTACTKGAATPASTPTTAAPTPVNAVSYVEQDQTATLQRRVAELEYERQQAIDQQAIDAQVAQNRQWRQEDYARCLEFNAASRANNVHAACVQPGP